MRDSEKLLLDNMPTVKKDGKNFSKKQSVQKPRKPLQSFLCFASFIFVITLLISSIIFGIQLVDKHFSKKVENFLDLPEINTPFLSSPNFYGHGQFSHHSHLHFCDMCTINPILDEEFVHCHSCDFNQMEEKELFCPKSFENMYILNVRVGERKNAELQGLVYNECRKQLSVNPAQHKCKINVWNLKFGTPVEAEEVNTPKSKVIGESAEKSFDNEIQRRHLIRSDHPREHGMRNGNNNKNMHNNGQGHRRHSASQRPGSVEGEKSNNGVHKAKTLPCGRMKDSGKDTRPGCYEDGVWKMPTKCIDTEADLVPGDCCKHPACDLGGELEKVTCSDGSAPEVHQHHSTACEQKNANGNEGSQQQRGTNQHHPRNRQRNGSQQNGGHRSQQNRHHSQQNGHHQQRGENNQPRGGYNHQRRGNRPNKQNIKSEVWLTKAQQSSPLPPTEFLLAQEAEQDQDEKKVEEEEEEEGPMASGTNGNDFGFFPFQDVLTVDYICTK